MRVVIIMNHDLTEEQEESLKGEVTFIRPGNIPVDETRDAVIASLVEKIEKELDSADACICQTEYELFLRVYMLCVRRYVPLYGALTERVVEEVVKKDKVEKKSVFKFRGWRRYWPLPAMHFSQLS